LPKHWGQLEVGAVTDWIKALLIVVAVVVVVVVVVVL